MTKRIGALLLLLVTLPACAHKTQPYFVITTTDHDVLSVDRVYVNPGIFPIGPRFKVYTPVGISWIEKDLTGVKEIYFAHEYDAQSSRCNSVITYADENMVGARCEPDTELICESIRGRAEIPLSKIRSVTRKR